LKDSSQFLHDVHDIAGFLEAQYHRYNKVSFIKDDPVAIPHRFNTKHDIEISGLLTALISWGKRTQILLNADGLMTRMNDSPYGFLMSASDEDLMVASIGFVHRTFNEGDFYHTLRALRIIYTDHGSIDDLFAKLYQEHKDMATVISSFSALMCSYGSPARLKKHFADPLSGSAAKRICMFLRWMVRQDDRGVDFGIWKGLDPSVLMCPLDVHSGRVARSVGLLKRRQNDWKAVTELTERLREFDPYDPVKYDFALFGSGMYEDHWS
jgi:uncharacterized protein (TIGR02757 family)